jgi:ribosomal protein S18 acetylase RimI-like enzyme
MNKNEFVIRYVSEEDKSLLINMYLKDIEENHEKASRFAEALIYKVKTLVCFHDKEVIGTISWDVRGGLEDGVVELAALGTSPLFHRQGIARELVLSLINETKLIFSHSGYKLRLIYLFMEKNNEIGRKFYKKMGFKELFTIPAFLPNDDAVFWVKYF